MSATPATAFKTPWHLWFVGGLSLLWNLGGAFDFFMTETKNVGYLKGVPPAQQEFCSSLPFWAVILWGIATWGAPLGSLMLLLRRRVAVGVFLVSLVAMVLLFIHNFCFAHEMQRMGGPGALRFAGVIFVIGLLLWVYARAMCRRSVLR